MSSSRQSFLLFILALIFITATILINNLSHHFYLFWQTGWVDYMTHLLGGIGASFFFLWIYWFSELIKPPEKEKTTMELLLVYILVVGLLWEFYEYHFGLVFYSSAYLSDTFSDLLMDFAGAAIAYSMVKYLLLSWPKK